MRMQKIGAKTPVPFFTVTILVIAVAFFSLPDRSGAYDPREQRQGAPVGRGVWKNTVEQVDQLNFGFDPIIGRSYKLSLTDPFWTHQVTLLMNKIRSLRIRIDPEGDSAGIIMFASKAGSPRVLQAVWGHDDMREPLAFWTDTFWTPQGDCDATGCPKIRFWITKGNANVVLTGQR